VRVEEYRGICAEQVRHFFAEIRRRRKRRVGEREG